MANYTYKQSNSTPYLNVKKQILLSIFTLGFWNYVWLSRIIPFLGKLSKSKRDDETSLLAIMFIPFYPIYWMVKTCKQLENEAEKDNRLFATAKSIILIICQCLISAVGFGLFITLIILYANGIITSPLALIGLILVDLIVCVLLKTPSNYIFQNEINEIAYIRNIEEKIPYSEQTVTSPYKSKASIIVSGIFSLGLAFSSWAGKLTGFFNRVGKNKRKALDEKMLCLLVPFYFSKKWALNIAKDVDDFSVSRDNHNVIYEKAEKLSKNIFIFGLLSFLVVPFFIAVVYQFKLALLIQGSVNDDVCMRKVESEGILEIRGLRKCFPLKKNIFGSVTKELTAVDDVSFVLKQGETLGIVGESGCGKTTMGRTLLKLYPSEQGEIIFNGYDITYCPSFQTRELRKQMQIIFQDPYSSLPPRSTVGGILSEPVMVHKIVPKDQAKEYVLKLMDQCGLRDYYYERYPHEFSGGQRQRICIARALSVQPKLVVCDEPVSALDVSIQAQIINLLKDLQKSMGLTYLFISHDLSVVKYISDKIGVMYLGAMVEFGDKNAIFDNPLHPYTKALFSAIPNPNPDEKMNRVVLTGDIPSPANPPKGCRFHTRCPHATERCKTEAPVYREYEKGHFAACHLLEENQEV